MEELIPIIIQYAYPAQESIKSSDFSANIKNLTDQIISIFRKYSLQYVPPFLNGMLKSIVNDARSEDKRRRYAAAVCVASLMLLFPFDDYISQYKQVIELLLIPGYKPIVHIGAIVIGRLARIAGSNRDLFLHDIIDSNRRSLQLYNAPDVRYAAAVIWSELAKTAPEVFFSFKRNFHVTILDNLQSGDRIICELLIGVVHSLFTSEAASIGSDFLIELQDLLTTATTKNFSDTLRPDEIVIYFQLLRVLLKLRPYISKKYAESLLLPKCVKLLQYQNFDIVMNSINTIVKLHKIGVAKVEKDVFERMLDVLFDWARKNPMSTTVFFEKVLLNFPNYVESYQFRLVSRLADFCISTDGPLFAYNLTVAAIESLPLVANISNLLSSITKIMSKAVIPTPIHRILNTLNRTRPKWIINFVFFKNQMLHVIRQELSSPTSKTDRLMISLLALLQIPITNLADAMELNSLIMTLITSKDTQVRERLAEASIHLFENMPTKIPLKTMIKLVSFALDDSSRAVRLSSLKAFNPITYKLLAQPDIFPIFSRFVYDESPEIRKEALLIFASLPVVTGTIIRNLLLSSLKQITSDQDYLTAETMQMWLVFPRLLVAATPWLNIYAEAIFQKFTNILEKRFSSFGYSEKSLVYMSSAMYQEIDEALIKSVSKLHQLCPEIVPMRPILTIFCKILTEPVHPWTKIHVLKSLKNLGTTDTIIDSAPQLLSVLFDMVLASNSQKLVAKAMKVIGSIGFTRVPQITTSSSLIFRNSLTNSKLYKYYFASTLINFLNEEFKATNLDTKREAIARVITSVFSMEPDIVPQFLEPFLGTYLGFIEASNERNSVFFQYLRQIIECGGHLMMAKAKTVYDAIQKHWHSSERMTKEASKVFCSLVVATRGRCEVILNSLVSESFLLLKMTNKSQQYTPEVFALLEIIAKLSPSYLSTIVAGIIEFLSSPSVPQHLQSQSLEAIDFIVRNCQVTFQLSVIKRCLSSMLQRSQARFRDRANQILMEVNTFFRSQSIENFDEKTIITNRNLNPHIEINNFLYYLKIPTKVNSNFNSHKKSISQWFFELRDFLLINSPSDIIKTITYLPQPPKFSFEFAFIRMWMSFDQQSQKEITQHLESFFINDDDELPEFVLSKFIDLMEFSTLCEIDLGVVIDVVIQKCIKTRLYSKALFFLETYLSYHPDAEVNIDYRRNLILMNQIVGRDDDARSIALTHKGDFGYDVWMKLGEWETALDCLKKIADPEKHITDQIQCLAALDDWRAIMELEHTFSGLSIFKQTKIARYLWTAFSYSYNGADRKEKALSYIDITGGYTVDDCIEKAVLLLKFDKIDEANKAVHLGWRYIGASISATEKNNINVIKTMLFRAEQLHELSDIIQLIRDPNHVNNFKSAWTSRLKFLKEEPLLQKELYKIRSLMKFQPSDEDLDSFAYKILGTTAKSHFSSMIPRMIDIFFPNEKSEPREFAKILYLMKMDDEAVDSAKELLAKTKNEKLISGINMFIGRQMMRDSKTIKDLTDSIDFMQKSNLSQHKLIECYSLLAFITQETDYAISIVNILASQKGKYNPIQIHLILALMVNFKISIEQVINNVIVDSSSLLSVSHTCLMLLTHSSEMVTNTAKNILSTLCQYHPQSITFDLLNNSNLPEVNNLIFQLQRFNPSTSSQLSFIASKLTTISENLFGRWIECLCLCSDLARKGDIQSASNILNNLMPSLDEINMPKYDSEFVEKYKDKLTEIITTINNDENNFDIERIHSLTNAMAKKQDSLRVVPLSAFDESLEKKNNWILNIFGSNTVKISRFYNYLQRLDNGFRLSIIGSNGKKYNYHLLRRSAGENNRLKESEQFMNLLNSITSACDLSHRTVIELSPNVLLIELLKGRLSIFDLVSMYNSSKNISNDTIIPSESTKYYDTTATDATAAIDTTHTSSNASTNNNNNNNINNIMKNVKIIEKLQASRDEHVLSKAIIVTSRNAMTWVQRSSMFSKSYGVLSAVSHIVGHLDTAPSSILFDKVSGAVTYTKFAVRGEAQAVPFRLTRMIVAALGCSGVNGPFRTALESSLKSVRRYESELAPCLQFFVSKPPFEPTCLPKKFVELFDCPEMNNGDKTKNDSNDNEIDRFYEKFNGDKNSTKNDVDILIQKASDIQNLAKMPQRWIPWW